MIEQMVMVRPSGSCLAWGTFAGALGRFGGPENWGIIPLFHIIIASLLFSSLKACILHLKEGRGITLLLYGENIVDSTMWSLQ